MVGDLPDDAEAAAKAGLPTVGVLCGGFPEKDLRAAGCVAVYRDPEDSAAPLRPLAAGAARVDRTAGTGLVAVWFSIFRNLHQPGGQGVR